MKSKKSTYYWTARPNFGDLLVPYILKHFSGIDAEWASPEDAELVVIGSVLDALPTGWRGTVAGAGKLHESTKLDMSRARVLALRGELTASGVPGDYVLGDPALLIDEMVPSQVRVFELGVVPHWTDTDLIKRFSYLNPILIDPSDDPISVATRISSCKKIVSSSLHGIIVADAYGIPRRAEMYPPSPHEGGEFKFHDYASSIKTPMVFGKVQTPERGRIEAVQSNLFDMLKEI